VKAVGLIAAVTSLIALSSTDAKASSYSRAREAVCFYFKDSCPKAMDVVRCETGGTYSPYARNGQYLGIFQMGSAERARFGHSWEVWGQARAAYAYWRLAGWRPWACA
jgi:hypothetical protein